MFVDLSLNSKKYCGTQPLCVRCFNRNEVVVDSWNSVFVEVCCALYKKNPIRFEKSTRTETFSRVILPSAQNMRKPALFVAGHYVETDFEDYEIIDWIKRLIDRLGIAAEAIVISYQLENLHADGSDKMVRPTSSPEMAQNSQIETNDLFKTISSEFNAWNGILKFGSVSSFAEFIYTRPESLSVYSGFGHIESTRNVVSYQFNSWVDILERILILLAQSQPDQVLLCLKKHCGSVASVFQTKDGLKKPILLFDQNYIDLFAFENDIPATVECICRLVRTLKIKSEECVIHFVVDDNLVRSTKDDTNAESQHDSSEDSVAAAEKTEQEETSDSKIELSDSEIDADSEELDEETVPDSVDVDEENDSNSEELDDATDADSEELDEEADADSEELDEEADADSEELDEEADSDSEDVDEEADSDSEDVDEDTEPAKKQVYYQFSLEKNYQLWADGTPVALYWRGEEVSVDSWPELFEEFCEKMLDECEERFIHILTDSELVSEDEDELRLPYRIRGEELYIETDRPAVRVMQLMAIWCSECGIPKDEIEIETMEWEDVEDEDDEDDIDDEDDEDDEYEDEELDEDEDDEDE